MTKLVNQIIQDYLERKVQIKLENTKEQLAGEDNLAAPSFL